MPHPAQLPIEKLLADCELRRQRRSGPGGQHRNKVETAVVIEHVPTGVSAEASERRSQEQNRKVAIQRLRVALAVEHRTGKLQPPSERWRGRVQSGRIVVNTAHEDFPALLAEALEALVWHDYQVPAAAEHLGVSNSQLLKFVKQETSAWTLVKRRREQLGLPRLR